MSKFGPRRKREGVLATLVLLMLVVQWFGVEGANWADSDAYRMGGKSVLDGTDIYSARTEHGFPFNYPPFAALLMAPLAMGPVGVSRLVLTVASVGCLIVLVFVLARALKLAPMATTTLGLAAAAIEPTLRTLLLGQINLILVAMVVIDLLVLRRGRGVLIGIAAGIKLTPAAFVVVLVLQRDWRSALRATVAFAGTVGIGFIVDPRGSAHFWTGGFLDLGEFDGNRLGTDNQTLLAAVLRLSHRADVPTWLELVLVGVGMGLATAAAARLAPARTPYATVVMTAAVAVGALLGSPVSWSHHWCAIIIPVALLLAKDHLLSAGVLTAVFWFPVVWLTYTDTPYGELDFSLLRAAASIPYVVIGLGYLTWLMLTTHVFTEYSPRPMSKIVTTD